MDLIIYSVSFLFIALAAKKIGHFFSKIGLPYITGYLLAGMVAGPFLLGLMPEGSSRELRYIDEISLAVIAFIAGSELYLKEIRGRLQSIVSITAGVIVVALILLGVTIFFLSGSFSFTAGMGTPERLAVAILGSIILLALSPASTIAVIKEVRAQGTFTRTVLGITVTMDVVIVLLFAVGVAVASALLTGVGFSPTFALLLVVDLGAALVAGYGVGRLLEWLLGLQVPRAARIGLILFLGYTIFFAAYWLIEATQDNFLFEVHVEPLLVAMIGGFYVTNFTRYREEFDKILHDVGPAVYVAFFTLTGVTLKLDILLATLPVALLLFATRAGGIFLGSLAGSVAAKEPARRTRSYWLGLITQAGIALGLAREVAVEFPVLGDSFATLIISVVVLNEIFGPMFLKSALQRAGEAEMEKAAPAPVPTVARDALILDEGEHALELAQYLHTHNWRVIMVEANGDTIRRPVTDPNLQKE